MSEINAPNIRRALADGPATVVEVATQLRDPDSPGLSCRRVKSVLESGTRAGAVRRFQRWVDGRFQPVYELVKAGEETPWPMPARRGRRLLKRRRAGGGA